MSLLLSTSRLAAQAEEFTYTTNNSEIVIGGYTGFSGVVSIPETINGLPVTGLDIFAFSSNTNLTRLTLPTGLKTIGVWACSGCTSLTNVFIPASVNAIASGAFTSCTRLRTIEVDALNPYYTSKEGVLLTKDLETLQVYPAGKVGSYVIPEGVRLIGDSAFDNCIHLTKVTIPESVTSMESDPFFACTNLSEIKVSSLNSDYSSKDGVLFNKALTWLMTYPAGKAGEYTIPESVTLLSDYAFSDCSYLTSVVLPDGLDGFEDTSFVGCRNFMEFRVSSLHPRYSTKDGLLFDKTQSQLLRCPGGKVGYYEIPPGVSSVADAAFADCVGLTHVEIPRGVRNISYAAFRDCRSLTSVTVPNGVSTLSAWVFEGCVNLSRVILPDTIKEIHQNAFAGCPRLGKVYFEGDAPLVAMPVFDTACTATVQFRQGTSGWGSEFAGRPTLLWSPEIRTSDSSFGVQNGRFGFTITGPSGMSVVVESCVELLFPSWKSVATNILSNGSVYFQDPESGDQSSRFYRLSIKF